MRSFALLAILLLPNIGWAQKTEVVVQPKGGHFAIRFPGRPKENTQSTKTDLGTLKVYTATYALPDGNVYLVSFTEFPAEAVKPDLRGTLYDGVVNGIKGKDGMLVGTEKEIEIGKEKGREVVIDKGKQQTRFRVVVKDDRLYQIALVGSGEFATGKAATAFLDSFEFK